jgi:hypothetical protein
MAKHKSSHSNNHTFINTIQVRGDYILSILFFLALPTLFVRQPQSNKRMNWIVTKSFFYDGIANKVSYICFHWICDENWEIPCNAWFLEGNSKFSIFKTWTIGVCLHWQPYCSNLASSNLISRVNYQEPKFGLVRDREESLMFSVKYFKFMHRAKIS